MDFRGDKQKLRYWSPLSQNFAVRPQDSPSILTTLSFTVYIPDFDLTHALNSVSIQQREEESGFFFPFHLSLLPPDKMFFVKNLPAVQWHQFLLDLCPTRCVPGVELAMFSWHWAFSRQQEQVYRASAPDGFCILHNSKSIRLKLYLCISHSFLPL